LLSNPLGNGGGNTLNFIPAQLGKHWQRENVSRQGLGMGQATRTIAKIGVGRLEMGWRRVVYIAAHASSLEVSSQIVAPLVLDHIQVIDVAWVIGGEAQGQTSEELGIPSSPFAAGGITCVKMKQLYTQQGGLKLIQARVTTASVGSVILAAPAIHTQAAQTLG
jgi:hypothetical protein